MKILIVAGGTGGHLYPGIALARALAGQDVIFVIRRGDMGKDILQKEGFAFREIAGQGLPRAFSFRALAFPYNFLRGWLETRSLLKAIRPDRVVGMGGYLSIPVIITAHTLGIRTLLHEQNAFPGLANRFLARWADSVAVSFPFSLTYFPKGKSWVSGLPVRPEIGTIDQTAGRQHLGLDPQVHTFLVFGGSLGAQKINTLCIEAWGLLQAKNLKFQVIHITGTKDFDRVQKIYSELSFGVKVMPFCHAMADAYAAADAVISRAGASTVAELLKVCCPALLIPYPHATNNHQLYNAQVLEADRLAQVVLDNALTASGIADFLSGILKEDSSSPKRAVASLPDAAQRLATYLI
jgi:UDP-N-acetylglucosamine--N-acetylmuramyl-(pentapeptide) pyrophosphoryl-undecaprenol N-acetylglucosamine transferase